MVPSSGVRTESGNLNFESNMNNVGEMGSQAQPLPEPPSPIGDILGVAHVPGDAGYLQGGAILSQGRARKQTRSGFEGANKNFEAMSVNTGEKQPREMAPGVDYLSSAGNVPIHRRLKEPRRMNTCLRGLRPGQTQTRLYSHRRWLEA